MVGDESVVSLLGQNAVGAVVEWTAHGPVVSAVHWPSCAIVATFRLAEDQAAVVLALPSVTNTVLDQPVVVDVLHTQDVALAPRSAVRTNEYYVSQYLDVTPVARARVTAPPSRSARTCRASARPGLWSARSDGSSAGATDALQLVTRAERGVVWDGLDAADLPSSRLQHEHTLVALQDAPVDLGAGETHRTGFFGLVSRTIRRRRPDADARLGEHVAVRAAGAVASTLRRTGGDRAIGRARRRARSLVVQRRPSTRGHLDDDGARRPQACSPIGPTSSGDGDGTGSRGPARGQLVTAAKQARRPAATRSHPAHRFDALTPDDARVTSTVWMAGAFHSQVTQGHVGR